MPGRSSPIVLLLFALLATGGGCGEQLDVGSDVFWSARFEANDFEEWNGAADFPAQAFPDGNAIEVSTERAHRGSYAAKLTINTPGDGSRGSAVLARVGADLPAEGYYSAWFYFPRSISAARYWVIFKFRWRTNPSDVNSAAELYDLNLATLPSGEMTLRLYNHRTASETPLDVPDPIAPVAEWFQIEAYFRNTPGSGERVIYWIDGRQILDHVDTSAPATPWVEWNPCSIGENLTPGTAVLYIDDAAISGTRVGPGGTIAR
jgi:hypothetical protein